MLKADLDKTKRNLTARGSTFALSSFMEEWNFMNKMRSEREALELQRIRVSQSIKRLAADQSIEVQNLKEEGKRLRSQLKDLTRIFWEIEEKAVCHALRLPNELHEKTPIHNSELFQCYRSLPESNPLQTEQVVSYESVEHSPTAFYMSGSYAALELKLLRIFSQFWIDNGFYSISAPDFVKSVIIDGCGMSFLDPSQVLSLSSVQDLGSLEKGNALHLVGGGSLPATMANLCKNVIRDPYPLRLVSMGRSYQPPRVNEEPFNTVQASSVQLLTTMENRSCSMYQECMEIQHQMEKQLEKLNVHFRTNILAAKHLETWEQYRVSFETFSSSAGKYVEVASISISKYSYTNIH
jgi:seryl-tRNA synthetase